MGLATEGNNISVYKACIKNANSLKNPALPFLFSKSNKLNLGPIPSFLPILTAVEELLIIYIHIHLQVMRIGGQQYHYTRHVSALTRTHQRLRDNYHSYLLNIVY
jgi:hypothetical protein